MNRPYRNTTDNFGISVCTDELLESAVEFCRSNHCQLSMHAMGGKAIDRMISRAAKEEKWTPEGIPYVRIEHVTDPSEESLEKAAEKGISFVTQPIFPVCGKRKLSRKSGRSVDKTVLSDKTHSG